MDAYRLFDDPFDPALEIAASHWSDTASLYLPPLKGEKRRRQDAAVAGAAKRRRETGDQLMAALIEFGHVAVRDGVEVRGSKLYPNG